MEGPVTGGRSEALQHERIAGVGSTTVIHLRTLQVLGNQLGSSGVLAVPAGYGVLSTGMAMRGLSVIMRPPSNGQQGILLLFQVPQEHGHRASGDQESQCTLPIMTAQVDSQDRF